MPKLTIDGREIEVEAGTTVLQAARRLDTEIPVFCYHERLDIAGNCRMCLVEQKGAPKPIASCAMPVMDGMEIFTNTEKVRKAREGVLEFLLMHHPLDCPVCDQGGECDLQDITMAYGRGESRYDEAKRAIPQKQMGPIVKTYMTRCIHCTRCVRLADRVGGETELGGVSRGENVEITTYLDSTIKSEFSGNLIDVCPVGALTSAPYAHKGRPWELRRTNSIDVMDAVGSNISVHTNGMKVRRVQPRVHEAINEEWLSDKSRYVCDALSVQRLDTPYIREKGKLRPASFSEAFRKIVLKLKKTNPDRIAALAGPFADCESMLALKQLMTNIGSPHLSLVDPIAQMKFKSRSHYLFNTTIQGIEEADAVLIIGANIRRDASLVMARLRKRYLKGGLDVAYLGGDLDKDRDLTIKYQNLGDDISTLDDLNAGKHAFTKTLKSAKRPMIILGSDALARKDREAIFASCAEMVDTFKLAKKDWQPFNILHTDASTVGGLDLGFMPQSKGFNKEKIEAGCDSGEIEVLYLLGADDDVCPVKTKTAFKIYQGHHGDSGAMNADVVLPGAAYTEKEGTYVNMEGRVQRTHVALAPPGEAKEDWRIIRALSDDLAKEEICETLPYDSLDEIREALIKVNPLFDMEDEVLFTEWKSVTKANKKVLAKPFAPSPFEYYMSNTLTRHSATMAKCEQELMTKTEEKRSA